MFQKLIDAVKRYSGYASFLRPAWDKYKAIIAEYPGTAGVVILGLIVLAVR